LLPQRHGPTVTTLRRWLLDRDVRRSAIRTKVYWADGKPGL
jgi:hypothetical protein